MPRTVAFAPLCIGDLLQQKTDFAVVRKIHFDAVFVSMEYFARFDHQ
jgi:hypothetical protein